MKVIVVEGIIGAGKTTLIDRIAKRLTKLGFNVAIASEPVDEWRKSGVLRLFYSDMKRYAYIFQTEVFRTRVQTILKAVELNPDADILLCERSPYTDRHVFMKTLGPTIQGIEMKLYNSWCDLWIKFMPSSLMGEKWKAVFVNPPIGICQERIELRGRNEESTVSDKYQSVLQREYEEFLKGDTYAYVAQFPNTDTITDEKIDSLLSELIS